MDVTRLELIRSMFINYVCEHNERVIKKSELSDGRLFNPTSGELAISSTMQMEISGVIVESYCQIAINAISGPKPAPG